MAFFNFRWPGRTEQGDSSKPVKRASRNAPAEGIEVMRRRARHRLIGAAVLVLVGIVGFPVLFDTQPRPVPVDIPIEIPDRNKVAPLVVPDVAKTPVAPASAAAPVAAAPSAPAPVAATAGLDAGEEVISPRPAAKMAVPPTSSIAALKVEHRAESKPEPRPEPKQKPESKQESRPAAPEPKPARNDDAARARALLEGRDTQVAQAAGSAAKAEDGRFIVQVGAFAEAEKAREARSKLEHAGLKTYTQVVDTKDGKRTRVRVGPFANRTEADKAAGRIKSLGLSASVLTL